MDDVAFIFSGYPNTIICFGLKRRFSFWHELFPLSSIPTLDLFRIISTECLKWEPTCRILNGILPALNEIKGEIKTQQHGSLPRLIDLKKVSNN